MDTLHMLKTRLNATQTACIRKRRGIYPSRIYSRVFVLTEKARLLMRIDPDSNSGDYSK